MNLKNMPFVEIENLLNSKWSDFKQRVIRFIVNKKEYKLTQDFKSETQNIFNDVVEEIFNMSTPIKEEEMSKIYEIDFVRFKLQEVLEKYLSNGLDD